MQFTAIYVILNAVKDLTVIKILRLTRRMTVGANCVRPRVTLNRYDNKNGRQIAAPTVIYSKH